MITLLIGTYASVPYVHLQLESRRRFYPQLPCFICDDCSPKAQELETLCKRYDAVFYSNPGHKGHSQGDWAFFKFGLNVCSTPYLLKLSRRFVPFCDITASMPDNWDHTLGERAFSYLPFLRSECIALNVKSWRPVFNAHTPRIEDDKIFVERELTAISQKLYDFKQLGYRNTQKYYDPWSLLSYRQVPTPFCLWHWNNSALSYQKLAEHYNLSYRLADFKNPSDSLLPITT